MQENSVCIKQGAHGLTFLESSDQCVNHSLFTGGRNTTIGELSTGQQCVLSSSICKQKGQRTSVFTMAYVPKITGWPSIQKPTMCPSQNQQIKPLELLNLKAEY